MFDVPDGENYLSERLKDNDNDLESTFTQVRPSDGNSLNSLEFCYGPELELCVSAPKDSRLSHRIKNKAKKSSRRHQKAGWKDPLHFNQDGLLATVFDSESEVNECSRTSNFYSARKSLTKTRKSDRNLKEIANHGRFLESTDSNSSSSNSLPPIIVTSQKYQCLVSMPVSKSGVESDSLTKMCSHRPSIGIHSHASALGADRVTFYKNFSLLIDLGKGRDRDMKRHVCSRQISSEEELWRSQFGDIVWLELQAFLNQQPPSKQDSLFIKFREIIPKICDEMLSFKVVGGNVTCNNVSGNVTCNNVDGISFSASPSTSGFSKSSSSCSCGNIVDFEFLTTSENIFGCCPGKVLQLFCEAAGQVVNLMQKLNLVESLYPTRRALLNGFPNFALDGLQRRISSLYLWFNISKDLFQHLKSVMELVAICKHKECSVWSCIDPQKINYILHLFSEPFAIKRDKIFGNNFGSDNSIYSQLLCESFDDENAGEESDEEDDSSEEEVSDDDNSNKDGRSATDQESNDTVKQSSKVVSFFEIGASNNSRPLSKSSLTSAESFESIPTSMTSIYRHYVDRNLKRTGMRKFCNRLKQMVDKTLSKAQKALYEINSVKAYENNCDEGKKIGDYMDAMRLPSFTCIYLFLCRVPLDIIHECLKLRLERQPKKEPSFHILRPLIHECKEVLSVAIDLKQYYLKLVSSINCSPGHEAEMEKFEDDLMKMLQIYFNHTQKFMTELQQLPEMSKQLKNFLEKEWNFMKKICSSIRNGEAYAGNRFCAMACSLIRSISDFLDSRIDECINQLFTNSALESSKPEDEISYQRSKSTEFRQSMMQLGRDLKLHFNEARERSCQALAFAKMLKKDLEVAAQYVTSFPLKVILETLEKTGHVQVIFPEKSTYIMFVPEVISKNKTYICHLLNVSCGSEECFQEDGENNFIGGKNGCESGCGYLVLTKMDDVDSSSSWNGKKVVVEPTAEVTIAFVHIEVSGWLLLASHSMELANCRKVFEVSVGDRLSLKNEQMSCHQAAAESLHELKTSALELRARVVEGLSRVSERLNDAELVDVEECEKHNVLKSNKETINHCFALGFEYHKELMRLISYDMRGDLSRSMIEFARQWMKFAESCDRGRGVKPRWASHGFDFLKISCEPRNLNFLNDEEFMTLTKDINSCISHVIGTKPTGCSPDVIQKTIVRNFSSSSRRPYASPSRSISNTSGNLSLTPGTRNSSFSAFKTSPTESWAEDGTDDVPNVKRVLRRSRKHGMIAAIEELEKERNERLMKDKVIGRVSNTQLDVDSVVRIRKVKFRWQRGIKIGEGQFGKVYIAINLDNDVLMAMKEIKLQPNDHQTIKKIDEEIKIFEGIKHPSLVQYFGVELYRDEMIIFMEYCQNGTIEDLAKQGLDEHMIRKYSNEILEAIYALHSQDIVHRDVKGANIFLMPNNSIKLGDFGCSVKLKSHTTMAGELNEYVGTPAFMAPEVIRGDALKGYGRAADIWSFGCVIIQMTTGNRPWPELENKIQIFFKVGSGAVPHIPETLSEEGKEFLGHCLDSEDEKRWTAEQLIDHPFVKISEEEDLES